MNISIEPAKPEDLPGVIRLLNDFAEYENLSRYCKITEEKLAASMFGDGGFVQCLVAADDGRAVGYAIFYPCFATFSGQKGVFLEDIFISEALRGKGVGDQLLRAVARYARSIGAERIDFQVLDWNTAAIDFYKNRGAVRNDEERHFKFDSEAFERLAK